ncbi:MAG: nucleotidyltransferase family protein [Rhodocyclales bacterium]|nr:nucleotidyltransferase family protein [Rhodocyclales bacterium]
MFLKNDLPYNVVMKPSIALQNNREVIRQAVARYPVCNARVFGSVIHHCDADGSDLDLLVDPLPGTTLFDLGAMQVELETVLGIPVDVLTPGDLPKRFREQVIREAMPV